MYILLQSNGHKSDWRIVNPIILAMDYAPSYNRMLDFAMVALQQQKISGIDIL